jgi:hypothetical protein
MLLETRRDTGNRSEMELKNLPKRQTKSPN